MMSFFQLQHVFFLEKKDKIYECQLIRNAKHIQLSTDDGITKMFIYLKSFKSADGGLREDVAVECA